MTARARLGLEVVTHARASSRRPLSTARWLATAASLAAVAVLAGGCHRMFDGEVQGFRCEAEGTYGPPACPAGETCVAGACTAIGAPFAAPCTSDGDCRDGTPCIDPADFGASGAPRCTELCCASSDCGAADNGTVCWLPPATTGGLCWPAAELGREAPGEGRPGASCKGPSDCRSALCEGGRCAGACCNDSYCDSDQVCRVRLSELAEREVFTCGLAAGPGTGGTCDSDDDCVSGRCVFGDDMVQICAEPCCSSRDCDSVYVGAALRPVACAVVAGNLRACSKLLPVTALGDVGAACVVGEDCRSGVCIEAGGRRICSDACCDDQSCGDAAAFACLPVQVGDTWALRCVPR